MYLFIIRVHPTLLVRPIPQPTLFGGDRAFIIHLLFENFTSKVYLRGVPATRGVTEYGAFHLEHLAVELLSFDDGSERLGLGVQQ